MGGSPGASPSAIDIHDSAGLGAVAGLLVELRLETTGVTGVPLEFVVAPPEEAEDGDERSQPPATPIISAAGRANRPRIRRLQDIVVSASARYLRCGVPHLRYPT